MCTVTWVRRKRGYDLLCNRDEKRTRKKGVPPRLAILDGVQYLAPIDADHGGTWIATNEFGLSACLLNGANLTCEECTAAGKRSRGLLLRDLMSSASTGDIRNRLLAADLSQYAPFTVIALDWRRPAVLTEWDGRRITQMPHSGVTGMLTSSSFDTDTVRGRRSGEFERHSSGGPVSTEMLWRFHTSHAGGPSAYSTCMHRPDAETVSFSWIHLSGSAAEFFYSPAALCKGLAGSSCKMRVKTIL